MSEPTRAGTRFGGRVSRRAMLRGSALGVSGLAAAALIGCGDDEDDGDGDGGGDDAVSSDLTSGGGDATTTESATGEGRLIEVDGLPYPLTYPEPATEPTPGGELTVAATWDVGPLDPTLSAAGGTIVIPNFVYNRLLGMVTGPDNHPDLIELEPELAKSWERSPDGLTFTAHLQEGVKWQNIAPLSGRELVANDVKQAYERYASEGVHTSYWSNVDKIDAVDDHTLQITLARPTADFEVPLATRYQTIFPPELVDSGEIEDKAIGTGPMILKEAVTADHVTWEKNPDYWERDVLLDKVTFKMAPDSSARLAQFRSGQADYAYSVAATSRSVETLVNSNPDVQINMTRRVYGGIPFAFNNSHPKFEDERVRRAVSLAIDRETMMQVVWDNVAYLLPGMPWIFTWDEAPTAENGRFGNWTRYAPDEARQLLDAAGIEELEFNNAYFPYSDTITSLTELLVDQFRQVGIKMTGGKVDYTEFNSSWVPGKLDEVTTSGWMTLGFDADNFFYNQIHSESPGNRWGINDSQIDEWADAQRFELDPETRQDLQRQIWERMMDQIYRPPLPSGYAFEILQPWVRGLRFGGALGNNSSYYDWGDQIAEAWIDESAK